MQISSSPHAKVNLVDVTGRIDQATTESFVAALQSHLAQCKEGQPPLVLNLAGVEYISSVGLRSLMVAARQAKAARGKIGIAALQPLVREVFSIARFDLVIPCFDTVADAAEGLSA